VSKAWRAQDLAGGGLQAANLKLARLLRRRALAFSLLALFPLGLHRFYLRDTRGGIGFLAASVLGSVAMLFDHVWLAGATGIVAIGFAVRDAVLMEHRIVALNKAIRTSVYLGQSATPHSGFKGRFRDMV
jgi:TM2 domain-containing membrane protein YozV